MEFAPAAGQNQKNKCPQCGCLIEDPIDQLFGVCADMRCRGPYLDKKSRERESVLRASEKAVIEKAVELLRVELDADVFSIVQECRDSARLSKVPNCDRSITELPEERVQKFTEHLKRILQRAIVLVSEPRSCQSVLTEYAHREWEIEQVPILPVLNGCTTCRGYCCVNGGDTAFLSAEQVAWQLLSDPTASIDAIEKYYMMRLPQRSLEDSCVYHTDRGCSLPRKQRASICNDFHCWELQDVLATDPAGDKVAWVSIACKDNRVSRAGIISSGGDRVEVEFSDLALESEDG